MEMKKEDIDKITHKIIGCAMEVHNILGNGFQEVIYHQYLVADARDAGKGNYFNTR